MIQQGRGVRSRALPQSKTLGWKKPAGNLATGGCAGYSLLNCSSTG